MAWPDAPEELLDGPRGRRLCFEVVSPWRPDGSIPAGPGWNALCVGLADSAPQQLAAELAALISRADLVEFVAAPREIDLFAPLHASVDAAMYWQPRDEIDQALAVPAVADVLAPVARALTGRPASVWWHSPLARDSQQFVAELDNDWRDDAADGDPALSGAADKLAAWRASIVEDERGATERPADPAAPFSGYWWSSPVVSRLVTTTRSLPGLPAVRLELVEDAQGTGDVACWPLMPSAEARICEIRGPRDWVALATRYPLDVSKSRRHDWWRVTGWAGGWVIPDFAAVAADFDAVHLTVGGYLTTAGRALVLDGDGLGGASEPDARTMLAGWNPDETYWLADVLTEAGPPERYINPDREPLGWKRSS